VKSNQTVPNPEAVLRMLLIEDDPIFRLGLRTCLEQYADVQIVQEIDTEAAALAYLKTPPVAIDLVVLALGFAAQPSAAAELPALGLLRQLKTRQVEVPVLLLGSWQDAATIATALQQGADGFCPKGSTITELVQTMRQITSRPQSPGAAIPSPLVMPPASPTSMPVTPTASPSPFRRGVWQRLRWNLWQTGSQQVEAALRDVHRQLQHPQVSVWDRLVLTGRRRELHAARQLLTWLWSPLPEATPPQGTPFSAYPAVGSDRSRQPPHTSLLQPQHQARIRRSQLLEATAVQLQLSLVNLTRVPLEIDILRTDKKQELLHVAMRQFETLLDELQASQIQPEQLPAQIPIIVRDLWQTTLVDFFGRYSTVPIDDQQVGMTDVLLAETERVQSAILNKIPLVETLLGTLLFAMPVTVDNAVYAADTPIAQAHTQALFQNLLIQVANAVIQPLLNHFADLEVVKQNFYDRRLISTREIERFRNNLSWHYRLTKYVGEPTAMFESCYWLFTFNQGIDRAAVYAPRRQELAQLSGIPLVVTLLLETKDAITPRLQSALSLLGSGLVYVLTEIVGRGIGLIGRGIVQGIGNAWQSSPFDRDQQRGK
jgi:DNA-binding NarL/FixJ family response regulator